MLGDTDASSVGISLVPCLKKNKTGNVRSAKHFWRVRRKRKNKFPFFYCPGICVAVNNKKY